MSNVIAPFQLLELNIISAQDLAPVCRHMKAYAVAWVHQTRKLNTRVDAVGQNNPTWNDKFVFRVDDQFLYTDTSAVMIEIYALHWFRDIHVGTVRVLVGNLVPPHARPQFHQPPPGMRFLALQVRRASGRPQGILNVGVALLNSSMRSMPIYTQMSSSAVGYRDLMGEVDPYHHHHHNKTGSNKTPAQSISSKPELRRTKSDTSSLLASDLRLRMVRSGSSSVSSKGGSMVNGLEIEISSIMKKTAGKKKTTEETKVNEETTKATVIENKVITSPKGSSILSASESVPPSSKEKVDSATSESEFAGDPPPRTPKRGKQEKKIHDSFESDVLNPSGKATPLLLIDGFGGGDPRKSPIVDGFGGGGEPRKTPKSIKPPKVKPYSNNKEYDAAMSPYPFSKTHQYETLKRINMEMGTPMRSNIKSTPRRSNLKSTPRRSNVKSTPRRSNTNFLLTPMKSNIDFGTPMRSNLAGRPILTESELGPSPSEVAAQLAKERAARAALYDVESSIISEWSYDDSSVEGLRSKLERWRTELPPLYDLGEFSSYQTSETEAFTGTSGGGGATGMRSIKHMKAKVEKNHSKKGSGGGLFSCFSNICGLECSIVCGSDEGASAKKRTSSKRRTPALNNLSSV